MSLRLGCKKEEGRRDINWTFLKWGKNPKEPPEETPLPKGIK